VSFGAAPGALTEQVDDGLTGTAHEVQLTGLSPDTTYFYAVGTPGEVLAGDDQGHQFTTAPPPGTAKPMRIWAIGDSGTANANAAAVRDAYLAFAATRPADLWLMLGDNAYDSGADLEYQRAVFDMYPSILARTVLWPAFGNHDDGSASSSSQSGVYYRLFTLPRAGEAGGLASGTEAYYSFDYGNLHCICLDSQGSDRSAAGAMMTWLANDLAATTAEWILAFWHHPPYTKGSHDSDDLADSSGRMADMREAALPLLEAGGVDLVLAGHSHVYERSFLLGGHYGTSDTLTPAMVLDNGDGREDGQGAYEKPAAGPSGQEGTVYVVAGCSGKTNSGPLDHPAMFIGLQRLGSVVIDIDGNTLFGRFLDSTGQVADHFTIRKP